ncbi:hypothetical protein EUTSA_v10010638mg [Eutrema salsugineum]|uniref:F-box domain-containing protein n=1 Tax=Eutrema salsugineum TaxID=72664 RepID=V4LSH2_EUTSA|nr:putative F-box/LRR-repeat protein 23 [Eutrema salsugineum]ESQ45452.1 hypothetical protein EUTSA_v10010638mg [Eutrema salsugineum]
MKDGGYRDWAGLPPELTSSILVRLDAIEILENAQKVCKSWHRVCKDPSMWRKIDMHTGLRCDGCYPRPDCDQCYETLSLSRRCYETMCRHAVDLSQGGLVEIDIWRFCTNSLLNYIADRSSSLRKVGLVMCHKLDGETLVEALAKHPLLEELDISYCSFPEESLKAVGKSCPNLKTLKLKTPEVTYNDDEFAIAIAQGMPGLRHLQLFGNDVMGNEGLEAILDSCLHLEHLDLRQCSGIQFVGDLEKRCYQRIRDLRMPHDSTDD